MPFPFPVVLGGLIGADRLETRGVGSEHLDHQRPIDRSVAASGSGAGDPVEVCTSTEATEDLVSVSRDDLCSVIAKQTADELLPGNVIDVIDVAFGGVRH